MFTQRYLFVLGSVCIALLEQSQLGAQPTHVIEAEGGFAYDVPADWTALTTGNEQYKALFGRNSDGNAANAHFYVTHVAGSVRDFASAYLKQSAPVTTADGVRDFRIVSLSDFKTNSGLKGSRAVVRGVFDGIAGRENLYFFELSAGRKIIIVCAFPNDENSYSGIFDGIMKSFTQIRQ